jgi:hypothetical protein
VELQKLEAGIKNKFKWSWLEEKDVHGEYISTYVRKLNDGGCAFCIWCKDIIKYGSSGKKAIHSHATRDKHRKARNTVIGSQQLPAYFHQTALKVSGASTIQSSQSKGGGSLTSSSVSGGGACNVPYGAPPNVHDVGTCPANMVKTESKPVVNLYDRKASLVTKMPDNSHSS